MTALLDRLAAAGVPLRQVHGRWQALDAGVWRPAHRVARWLEAEAAR